MIEYLHTLYNDPQWLRGLTLVIFIATYIGIASGRGLFFRLDRTGVAMLGAIAMLATGCITLPKAITSVHFESILMLFGLMVIAGQLHHSGLYRRLADLMVKTLDKPALFLAILMTSSGLLSAFLNNDVICLAITPVAGIALVRKRINPVPYLIAIALSSNIGCALTLIGNAQNVLLGQVGQLNFGRYMLFAAAPVAFSMLGSYFIVLWLARSEKPLNEVTDLPVFPPDEQPFNAWRATKGISALVIVVILCVFTDWPQYLIVLTAAGLLLCSRRLYSREVLKLVEWQLLVLFIGLFVVVGTFIDNGWGTSLLEALLKSGMHPENPYVLTVLGATVSNLINNSAAVVLLVRLLDPTHTLNFSILALTNAFAGNLLLFGSLANIFVVQAAGQMNIKITFANFARYGIPTALWSLTVVLAWIPIWS